MESKKLNIKNYLAILSIGSLLLSGCDSPEVAKDDVSIDQPSKQTDDKNDIDTSQWGKNIFLKSVNATSEAEKKQMVADFESGLDKNVAAARRFNVEWDGLVFNMSDLLLKHLLRIGDVTLGPCEPGINDCNYPGSGG